MRPIEHVLICACAATALSAAAAHAGSEEGYYTIKLTNASIASSSGPTGDAKVPITSFLWSANATASTATGRRTYEPVTFRKRVGGSVPASGGGTNEMKMDDTAGKERTAASGLPPELPVMSSITEGGVSGQATGKRQHKPLLARGYYDSSSPPQSGTLTVLASGGSCRVGARYPSLELTGGGKTYVLQGVTVTSCGGGSAAAGDGLLTEEISFAYKSIEFDY